MIALSQVIEVESSFQLIKIQFESKFENQVFKLNQNFDIKYSSQVMMLIFKLIALSQIIEIKLIS